MNKKETFQKITKMLDIITTDHTLPTYDQVKQFQIFLAQRRQRTGYYLLN